MNNNQQQIKELKREVEELKAKVNEHSDYLKKIMNAMCERIDKEDEMFKKINNIL